MPSTISAEQSFDIIGESPMRKSLLAMLNHQSNGTRVEMSYLFPKFLKVSFFKALEKKKKKLKI